MDAGSAKVQDKIAQTATWASQKMMDYSEKMQARSDPREQPVQVCLCSTFPLSTIMVIMS